MADSHLGRRDLFKIAGVAGIAAALPTTAVLAQEVAARKGANHSSSAQHNSTADTSESNARAYTFLNTTEAAFVESAVAVFIPKDDLGPGALEADVSYYIDHQLSGAFGQGARMYLHGPFADGLPQQGYQLPLTPGQIYRLGIRAVNEYCQSHYNDKMFDQLTAQQQDELLKRLEQGQIHLDNVPGPIFVNLLFSNTVEGFFGDPAYSGNHEMVGWKLVGFPGAYGMYVDEIESYRNKQFTHSAGHAEQAPEGQ